MGNNKGIAHMKMQFEANSFVNNVLVWVLGEEKAAEIIADKPDDLDASVEYVIASALKEQYQKVVFARFHYGMTYENAGACVGVSTERARQILAKSRRVLLHPQWCSILERGVQGAIRFWAAISRVEIADNSRDFIAAVDAYAEGLYDPLDISLADLNISVAAYNALRRAGLNSIRDVFELSPIELSRVRNFGRKTAENLFSACEKVGFNIGAQYYRVFGLPVEDER